jgi:hypothetical protein
MAKRERVCTKCSNIWPETPVYFTRSPKSRGGLHTWCRACLNEYAVAYYWRKKAESRG